MHWRDLVGWRHLSGRRRALLKYHTDRVARLFDAFEADGDDPRHLLNEPLENLQGGRVLLALPPDLATSAVIAAVAEQRVIPIEDKRSRVALYAPSRYRRYFAADRVIAYGLTVSLPYSAQDVALLFELALNSGNLDQSLRKVKIGFGRDWDQFAATRLVDQLLAETRVPLLNVALNAAEGLMTYEFSSEVAELLVRSRARLQRIKPASFETSEALQRIEALLERPLSGPDDTD